MENFPGGKESNLTLNPLPQTECNANDICLFIVFSLILIASESPVFKAMLSHIMRFHVKFNVESP